MKQIHYPQENRYYTTNHEWIQFLGNEAYIGVSNFRLKGVKKINKIDFIKLYGCKMKGDVVARIQFDYTNVEIHMPVEGKIISINDIGMLLNRDLLLTHAENDGWLVKIRINQPCQKDGLIPYNLYVLKS